MESAGLKQSIGRMKQMSKSIGQYKCFYCSLRAEKKEELFNHLQSVHADLLAEVDNYSRLEMITHPSIQQIFMQKKAKEIEYKQQEERLIKLLNDPGQEKRQQQKMAQRQQAFLHNIETALNKKYEEFFTNYQHFLDNNYSHQQQFDNKQEINDQLEKIQ